MLSFYKKFLTSLALLFLGEWMNTSAGFAFATHVISVEAGEVHFKFSIDF